MVPKLDAKKTNREYCAVNIKLFQLKICLQSPKFKIVEAKFMQIYEHQSIIKLCSLKKS